MTMFNFNLPAGDNAKLELTVRNQDLSLMDLTGTILKWSSKLMVDPTTRLDLEVGSGITVLDAINGRIDVEIPKDTIVVVGGHRHELEVILGTDSQTALEGEITVTPTINSGAPGSGSGGTPPAVPSGAIRAISGPTVITVADSTIEVTSGTFVQPLPPVVDWVGIALTIKNSGNGVVTAVGDGSETIDGNSSLPIGADESLTIMGNAAGTDWMII